jgi:hypothetical protein
MGSWLDGSDSITRSLHGQISVFRIWNKETDGQDVCPDAQTPGLIASYVFGHSSDTLLDLSGNSYDADIHDADWSEDLPPSQQCQRQGFGGFFDGDSDYVTLPTLKNSKGVEQTSFDALSIDLWIKFGELNADSAHPIFMEDGWPNDPNAPPGTTHVQIYQGKFDFSISGFGDYVFGWQPEADTWYFLQVSYQSGTEEGQEYGQRLCTDEARTNCAPGSFGLRVDNTMAGETNAYPGGSFGGPSADQSLVGDDGRQQCPCALSGPPIHFNKARIGGWDYNADGIMDRSMRGQIAEFRLWDKIKNGEDRCIPGEADHDDTQSVRDSLCLHQCITDVFVHHQVAMST